MAIVRMCKFDLMLLKEDQDKAMHALQRFGNVHFKALEPSEDGRLKAMPTKEVEELERKRDVIRRLIAEIQWYEKANRWLVSGRERRDLMKRDLNVASMTFDELEQQARDINIDELIGSMDENSALHEGGSNAKVLYYIEPWQKKSLKDSVLVEIRDSESIIGTVDPQLEEELSQEIRQTGQIYAVVSKEKDGSILFIMKPSLDGKSAADILAQKYHLERRSAEAVKMNKEMLAFRHKMDKMISRRNRTDGSLERLAGRKRDLMIYFEYVENLLVRANEARKFLQTESTLIVEGWVPQEHQQELERVLEEACGEYHVLTITEASKDSTDTPVQLRNNIFASTFESVTQMYSTPKYNELDPTPIFAPFYLLFFGMMLADIGYGLLMMVVTLGALTLFKLKPGAAKAARFLFYLSFSTILWGFIYGAFFAGMVPMTPLVDTNSEYNRVLIMAISFGIVHLLVALGVKAYIHIRDGHPMYALYDVGFWYMTLIGAIALLVQGFLPALAPYKMVFVIMMAVGMLGIVLTNGRSARTVGGKMASGLYSLYGLTGYVSDIVSYSRLMALGLAGGSIGVAINMMVNMLGQAGIIGILVGAGLFIGGHMFNMAISGLSSYVHSSRLIYVEFFSKFYTGGGVLFTPFRARSTYVNII